MFDHIFNVITGLSEIAIWWMIWQDYRKARGKSDMKVTFPAKRWMAMIALSLGPLLALGINHYAQSPSQDIPEFDSKESLIRASGGGGASKSCTMTVNGKVLQSRRAGYKLAIACFVWDRTQDILDARPIQVSGLYDIRNDNIRLLATWGDSFNQYLIDRRPFTLTIALLNVPNGVTISQFSSLREARRIGVLIPDTVEGVIPQAGYSDFTVH